MIDAQLQADLNRVINRIAGISPAITKDIKKELKAAAKPMVQSIKAAAPRGRKPHTRISGGERIVYKPGNLKRSFRVLNFRRAKTGIYIGAKLGGAADGYYAHFVNDGTIDAGQGASQNAQQFFEKGINAVKSSVLSDSVGRISRLVEKYWVSSIFASKR